MKSGTELKDFVDEEVIYEDIKSILMDDLATLKKKKNRDAKDAAHLFTLARTYAVLKDDLREDTKSDLFAKLGIKR